MSDFSVSSSAALCDRFKSMWTETDCTKRTAIQDSMQEIVDTLSAAEFEEFDGDPQKRSSNPVLQYYDAALERLLAEIPATQVQPGTVVVWYLYNLGFVIKTPQSCFGIDIHHRNAEKLAPLLDFVTVTHNHNDHYSMPLLRKMNELNKLVISNFFPNPGYTKAVEYTHELPGVTIYCSEADHNPRLKNFTMPMEFVCETGDKKFVFFTSGDCFSHDFLNRKSDRIHLYALHPCCGMVPVNAVLKLDPDLTLICHLQELGHEINRWRWQFSVGREFSATIEAAGKNVYVPIWGEKLFWDGNTVSGCQK